MADDEEVRWLRATANDLNNLLQVISESSQALQGICESHPEGRKFYAFLRGSLDRATNITIQLAARLGGKSEGTEPIPQPAAPVRPVKEFPIEIANPNGGELILVIDDEEMVVGLVRQMLTSAGYRVIVAREPFRALEIFRMMKDDITLVMLDFSLPIMDGSEVFAELQKIRPDVSVMLSSGFAEQDKVHAMLVRGLRGFLPKPYSKTRLLEQVRSTIDAVNSSRTGSRRVL
jgi:CheY-like chemotaxis protein